MSKHERMHYLNLCGHPVPDRLMPNNTRRERTTGREEVGTRNEEPNTLSSGETTLSKEDPTIVEETNKDLSHDSGNPIISSEDTSG